MKNFILAIKSQLPIRRLLRNIFVTRNFLGLFSHRAHWKADGTEKIGYSSMDVAIRVSISMEKKYGRKFEGYKCVYCDNYHVGKNMFED